MPPLSLPLPSSAPPIRGGTADDVESPRGSALTMLGLASTYIAGTLLVSTVALVCVAAAGDASGLVVLLGGLVVAAVILYCVIAPATAIARARCDLLLARTGADAVWCVWVGSELDDLVLSLPAPGTQTSDPTATFVMYLAMDADSIAFWTRRGRTYEQVLWIPISRLLSVTTTLDLSTGQPQTRTVVDVLANNGVKVSIPATAQPTSWHLRAASRELSASLGAVAAAARAIPARR